MEANFNSLEGNISGSQRIGGSELDSRRVLCKFFCSHTPGKTAFFFLFSFLIRSPHHGKAAISLCKFLWVRRRGELFKLPITLLLLKEIKEKNHKRKGVRRIKDLITVRACCPGCVSCCAGIVFLCRQPCTQLFLGSL